MTNSPTKEEINDSLELLENWKRTPNFHERLDDAQSLAFITFQQHSDDYRVISDDACACIDAIENAKVNVEAFFDKTLSEGEKIEHLNYAFEWLGIPHVENVSSDLLVETATLTLKRIVKELDTRIFFSEILAAFYDNWIAEFNAMSEAEKLLHASDNKKDLLIASLKLAVPGKD